MLNINFIVLFIKSMMIKEEKKKEIYFIVNFINYRLMFCEV